MVRVRAVSGLWDEDDEVKSGSAPLLQKVFFTVPPELKARIHAAAAASEGKRKGAMKDYLVAAIELDLDLQALLEPNKARIRAYAASHGLSMKNDRAKIIAQLVLKALDRLSKSKK